MFTDTAEEGTTGAPTKKSDGGGSDATEKNQINVGTLVYKGETKRYAIVPRSVIANRSKLKELLHYWELPSPDFVVQMNPSVRGKGDMITEGNEAIMLRDMLFSKREQNECKEEEEKNKNKNGEEATQDVAKKTSIMDKFLSLFARDTENGQTRVDENAADVESNPPSQEIAENSTSSTVVTRVTGTDQGITGSYTYGPMIPPQQKPADMTKKEWKVIQEAMTEGRDDAAWKPQLYANKYVQRKIVEALSGVVSAAHMMKGVILCHGPPSANERLLEAALDLTGSAPRTLVVDRFKNYDDCRLWVQMRENAKKMDPERKVKEEKVDFETFFEDRPPPQDAPSSREMVPHTSLNRQSMTTSWPRPTSHDDALWDESRGEKRNEGKMPWTRATHFIFCDNYEDFKVELICGGRSGYICINGGAGNTNRKHTGFIIRDSVTSISPCLLFRNTGAETQAYARLIDSIIAKDEAKGKKWRKDLEECEEDKKKAKKTEVCKWLQGHICCCCKCFTASQGTSPASGQATDSEEKSYYDYYEALKLELRRDAPSLRQDANLGHKPQPDPFATSIGDSPEDVARLSVADVYQIIDHYIENPRLFKNVVVTCDPFNESRDDIARKLMLSVKRSFLEHREVGAGNADREAVEQAWILHYQLNETRTMKGRWRSFLYHTYIVAGLLTVWVSLAQIFFRSTPPDPSKILAICSDIDPTELMGCFNSTWADQNEGYENEFEMQEEVLRWSTLALAALVSLSFGILNLMAVEEQLRKIQDAQAKILSELFQFRMRVGKYSLDANEREEAEENIFGGKNQGKITNEERREETNNNLNLSAAMMRSRKKFAREMKGISSDLTAVDLYKCDFTQLQGSMTNEHRRVLERHVAQELHLDDENAGLGGEMGLSGVMTSLDYYRYRVLPNRTFMEAKEDSLRFKTRFLQIFSMIFSTVAVILSAAGLIGYIPGIVAIATVFTQYLKVYDYQRRFEIASGAAREFGSLNAYWQSLNDLKRHLWSPTSHLVTTCEKLSLQFETMSTIQVDKAEIGMDEKTTSTKGLLEQLGFSVDDA